MRNLIVGCLVAYIKMRLKYLFICANGISFSLLKYLAYTLSSFLELSDKPCLLKDKYSSKASLKLISDVLLSLQSSFGLDFICSASFLACSSVFSLA